jgi:hypothetical protein
VHICDEVNVYSVLPAGILGACEDHPTIVVHFNMQELRAERIAAFASLLFDRLQKAGIVGLSLPSNDTLVKHISSHIRARHQNSTQPSQNTGPEFDLQANNPQTVRRNTLHDAWSV